MYVLRELGYVLICQVKEKEKYVVLKMLLQRRAKAQQEIKIDQSKDCNDFQYKKTREKLTISLSTES